MPVPRDVVTSLIGPSRHFAAAQQSVALGGKADIESRQLDRAAGCLRPDIASLALAFSREEFAEKRF